MPKTIASVVLILAVAGWACGGGSTPPPLTPDGPDMDLDAAVYQDDASPPESTGL